MYSTPGISHSSFSIGLVTRSSTSRADAPGICTKTSTIGTMICGSSSRGSFHTAKAPSSREPAITRGVSLEPIQTLANFPARPSGWSVFTGGPPRCLLLALSHRQGPAERERSPFRRQSGQRALQSGL